MRWQSNYMWAENKNNMLYNQGIPEGLKVNIRQKKEQTDALSSILLCHDFHNGRDYCCKIPNFFFNFLTEKQKCFTMLYRKPSFFSWGTNNNYSSINLTDRISSITKPNTLTSHYYDVTVHKQINIQFSLYWLCLKKCIK